MSAHVDPALLETARDAAREVLLDHAASCATCRRAIAAYDPSLLFALLGRAPMPQSVLDEVSAGASRRLAAEPRPWMRPAAAAAIAAAALLTWMATSVPNVPRVPMLAAAPPRAGVEVAPMGGVSQVVDFTFGDTQVVMVYNPDLEL